MIRRAGTSISLVNSQYRRLRRPSGVVREGQMHQYGKLNHLRSGILYVVCDLGGYPYNKDEMHWGV